MPKCAVSLVVIGVCIAAIVTWTFRERSSSGLDVQPSMSQVQGKVPSGEPGELPDLLSTTQTETPFPVTPTLSDAFGSSPNHLGPHTLDNLQQTYFTHIDGARAGDHNKMAVVSKVLTNCQLAFGWKGEAGVFSAFDQGLITLKQANDFVAKIKECDPIALDVKNDYPEIARASIGVEASFDWMSRSAAAGNRVARLALLVDVPGQSAELASLLDELIDTKDPTVLFKASEFESVRSSIGNRHLHERWNYLGCLHHPQCDPEVVQAYIQGTYSPSEQYEIFEFVRNFGNSSRSEVSFQKMLAEQPYTIYSELELEHLQKLEEVTRSTGKVGIEARGSTPSSMDLLF